MRSIYIAGREIGANCPPFIIAEMSGNHNGEKKKALDLIEAASKAGADAVKLQTYTADTITINSQSNEFKIKEGLWKGRTLYELYDEAHTPWEWHEDLFDKAKELGIILFSSPFDFTAVDFLENLATPAYKIASFELLDLPLVHKVAKTGKPMIMSTGMASRQEIKEALYTASSAELREIILLHCVSGYPTPTSEINLKMIRELSEEFNVLVGLSDHTMGTIASTAAVGLGACVIEKHFTLSRSDGGPDAAFSLEPSELRELVISCRTAWESLGDGGFKRAESEKVNLMFRRSLYVVEDIAMGEKFTEKNIRSIRPGYGLAPKNLPNILGEKARFFIKKGTALNENHIIK